MRNVHYDGRIKIRAELGILVRGVFNRDRRLCDDERRFYGLRGACG